MRNDGRPRIVLSVSPAPDEVGVASSSRITVTFDKSIFPETIGPSSFGLRDDHDQIVPAAISYQHSRRTAILTPATALRPGATYQVTVTGGARGIKDLGGSRLPNGLKWSFTTGIETASSPPVGPGGPILVIASPQNGFSQYYAEILRNEGFNEFTVFDSSKVDATTLQGCDVALLGQVPLDDRQVLATAKWVSEGGNLIAMRPDSRIASAFGLSAENAGRQASSLNDAYMAIDTAASAGAGLVKETIQFHGSADKYILREGSALAMLYRDAKSSTPFPAVWVKKFGRGNVVFFSYDLARSVIYTRQGNPLWSGLERDGISPVRPDDLFYGASSTDPQPDWVDPEKLDIPQADEQQRLLANVITLVNLEKKPLPHFWYLPRGIKAAIVMTGDDHGSGGTVGRFESYLKKSPPDCSLENWGCIRATSNIFVGAISSSEAASFANQGFEIALHVNAGCTDWPTDAIRQSDGTLNRQVVRAAVDSIYDHQLAAFAARYPGVPSPVTSRIDCITWSDFDTLPQVELDHGIRFDTNYYFWPPQWVRNRPGFFTGSGMPMRFAKRDGSIIDVYQAATQMTDESKQVYPFTIDTLLSKALGDSEYYGVFTVNMHNDRPNSLGADAVIASALYRHVPVVSAAQMLKWLDGRNASSFQNLTWADGQLGFTTVVGTGGNGIQALLPVASNAGELVALTCDGRDVKRELRTIAGLKYAAFSAALGQFIATYRRGAKQSP